MVAHYIVTQPILDLCEHSSRRPGLRVSRRRWEQASLYLEGSKKRAAVLEAETEREESIVEEEKIPL